MTTAWRARLSLILVLAGGLLLAPAATAQESTGTAGFSERQSVTAIDLLVEARRPLDGKVETLNPGDLMLLEDGEKRSILSVAPVSGDGATGEGAEPWRLVAFFDAVLLDTDTLRAAAFSLAEQARQLTALGSVEVVVADPDPVVWLQATRNAEEVDVALSRLFVELRGQDEQNRIRRLLAAEAAHRRARPQSQGEPAKSGDLAEKAAESAEQEAALLQARHDLLTVWLSAEGDSGPKALFLPSAGFDMDPATYYRAQVSDARPFAADVRRVAEATYRLGRSLAGYGWITHVLAFSELADLPPDRMLDYENFRRAGLGKIAEEQGSVVPLSGILQLLRGKKKEADAAPDLLRDRLSGVRILAQETGGEVLEAAPAVAEAVERLGRRFRVTYQVDRPPDGRLHRVILRGERGIEVRSAGWARSATPEEVVQARARRILGGHLDAGDLTVAARLRSAEQGGALEVRIEPGSLPATPPVAERTRLRIGLLYGGEALEPTFVFQILEDQNLRDGVWRPVAEADAIPVGAEWAMVVAEDLPTGFWGTWELDLEE